jgi:hypothetical protein
MDEVLRYAGYENLAARRYPGAGGYLPLELVLTAAPDVIVFSRREARAPAMAEVQLEHPALRRLLSGGQPGTPRRAAVAENLWTCAGAYSAAAVRALRAGS